MAKEKIVRYDLDGYDAITSALRELLNQFPGLKRGEEIAFSELQEDTGIAMFPTSGAIVETEKTTITGKVTEVCLYPFFVVYRASGLSENRKAKVKEWLDTLGRWLEQKEVVIDDVRYKLEDLPPLTEGRVFLSINRQSPAYMDNTSEDKTEDWVVSISARYQYEYKK